MRYIILAICLALLVGCSAVTERPATAMLTVQYTTMKYIGGDPVTAERVRNTAERIKSSLSGDVTLALLGEELRAQIPWDQLDAADQILLDALLLQLAGELRARMGDGALAPEDVVALTTVADWVIRAAR